MKISLRQAALTLLTALVPGCAEPESLATEALALERGPADGVCAFTEVVSPDAFDTTERSGVTTDGRVFFIGTRPGQDGTSLSWLAEIAVDPSTQKTSAINVLAGTLAGTTDGKLAGPAAGGACTFSGMATYQKLIYAACYATDGRASLVQVDLDQKTVRAGDFTTCNAEPSGSPCRAVDIYPNGMAVDSHGRVYASSMLAHVTGGGAPSIVQIEIGPHPAEAQKLSFHHRAWLTSDIITDGIAPNGVQIAGDTLFYAAGANVNTAQILANGSAGPLRVHYHGPFLTYIDDFSVHEGAFVLAHSLPGDLAVLQPNGWRRSLRQRGSCWLPGGAIASSVTRMPGSSALTPVFSEGTYVVTAFFGGGVYTVARLP